MKLCTNSPVPAIPFLGEYMSLYYLPKTSIPFDQVRGLKGDVHEDVNEHTTENNVCLTNGEAYLWASKGSITGSTSFAAYGANCGKGSEDIIKWLSEHFRVEILKEGADDFRKVPEYPDHFTTLVVGKHE